MEDDAYKGFELEAKGELS